ncbi:tigger transposable element-derived protein 1-like [Rhizophagus clarus]|uniref:Tigger transposable element-derived protein 1-like n=2 Tax=Rhizophagus clarus TaxID=94130 RepID=A0A8H3LBJ9_9GLOM|nr:tigger transposable element-derived protein 1-like [Rhizophagus clarus]
MPKTQNTKISRTQIAIGKGKISQEKILSKRASLSFAQKHEICLKKATKPSIKNKKLAKLFDQGEAASAPLEKLDEFREELQDLIRGYSLDDVFNCDETGLYWKIEPKRTISNKPVSGRKQSKDRVTILLCSNATGTEKLKPAFIHKYKNSRPLKNLPKSSLPVEYYWNAHYRKLLLQNCIKAFDFQQETGNNDTDSQDGIEENEHEEMKENERSEIQGLIDKLEYTYPLTVEEYIRIDQENEIDGKTPTEEQIVAILKENNSISDDESDREIALISSSEVLAAFDKIFIYLEQNNNQNIIDKSAFKAMKKARREVYRNNFFLKKQMSLDLFVKSNNSIDGIGNMNREGVKDNIIDVDNINFETSYFNERDIYNHEEEYEGFIEYQIDQDSLYK